MSLTPKDVEVMTDRLTEYETLVVSEAVLIAQLAGDKGPLRMTFTDKICGLLFEHITTRTKASILADITERLNQVQAELALMGIEGITKRRT